MKKSNLLLMVCCGLMLGIAGCATSGQYMKAEDSRRVYNKSYEQVFEAAPAAVKDAHMVFIESRKDDGVIDVVAPPSFWTSSLGNLMQGGDKVTIAIKKIDETHTSVEVTSQSRGDIVDFGRSARVVGTLLDHLDKKLQ